MGFEIGFACAEDRLAGGKSGGYRGLEIGPQRLLVGSCQRQRLRMLLPFGPQCAYFAHQVAAGSVAGEGAGAHHQRLAIRTGPSACGLQWRFEAAHRGLHAQGKRCARRVRHRVLQRTELAPFGVEAVERGGQPTRVA